MSSEKHLLCIFNLDNQQSSYASCMRFLAWLESIQFCEEKPPFSSSEFIPFLLTSLVANVRIPVENIERILSGEQKQSIREIKDQDQFLVGLRNYEERKVVYIFHYYFRISMGREETDLVNLQYFTLLLQSMPELAKRAAAFFPIISGSTIAEINGQYARLSDYLRLLPDTYQLFYAVFQSKNKKAIAHLTHNAKGVQQTFLPLLEIDGDVLWMLCQRRRIQIQTEWKNFHQAVVLNSTEDSPMAEHLFQTGARMLFNTLNKKDYAQRQAKQNLLELLQNSIESMKGVSALHFVLFGALIAHEKDTLISVDTALSFLHRIVQLTIGIEQLLENIVYHSQHGKGFFTFRIQRNAEYVEKTYPGFIFSQNDFALELLIVDGNRENTIVTRFLKGEKSSRTLRERENEIFLSDFFGNYGSESLAAEWLKARAENPALCHGLLTFSNAVREFGGVMRVRSNTDYTGEGKDCTYYKNYSNESSRNPFLTSQISIPGTQFSLLIDRIPRQEYRVHSFTHSVYATTYRELAHALYCKEEPHVFFNEGNEPECLSLDFSSKLGREWGQAKKDDMISLWKEWLDQRKTQDKVHDEARDNRIRYIVYDLDMRIFCDRVSTFPQELEPFCKGFLSSVFFASGQNKIKCYFLMRNITHQFIATFQQVLYQFSMFKLDDNVNIYFYFQPDDGELLSSSGSTFRELMSEYTNDSSWQDEDFANLFPYALFIKDKNQNSLFEQEMIKRANTSLTVSPPMTQGYKINDTHMRLGNKVHIGDFYEMALFFENPHYAYYTAFLFLEKLIKCNCISGKSKLLLFGYASYSRAILWAMIRILQEYYNFQNAECPKIEFVIYQNDLKLESEQPQFQMYYSKKEWQKNPKNIWNPDETTLVQIVPISSSLTTFNKMQAEFCYETDKTFLPSANLTACWVRDEFEAKLREKGYSDEQIQTNPTEEESSFWQYNNPETKQVCCKLAKSDPHYLIQVTCTWQNPLSCNKCFPQEVIMEYPLVETDPTSTVPTQQLYWKAESLEVLNVIDSDAEIANDNRVARLKGNIFYGHISRARNHFQFYVRTREYFLQEREEIEKWLKGIPKNYNRLPENKLCMNILIIPKQTSNVEFGQFIYDYYFNGNAESVVVNTEKEFRSNFFAEYHELRARILDTLRRGDDVHFHYADTGIGSGSTFQRAMSLIDIFWNDSLCKKPLSFDQVFLLISRMSEASKRIYVVNPQDNFHAYVELGISSMRNFGDSCVPCKLQREVHRYHQSAATKSISAYWENKKHTRACVSFDTFVQNEEQAQESYQRMICTHRATRHLQTVRGCDMQDYFRSLRSFFSELQQLKTNDKQAPPIYCSFNGDVLSWLSAGIKVMARPFFSYDYRLRCAVMDLYLILSEYFLNPTCHKASVKDILRNSSKSYLLKEGNVEWIFEFAGVIETALGTDDISKLIFLQSNLLKSLADLKSNYLMRKQTILNITRLLCKTMPSLNDKMVMDFYEHYLRSILRLVHSSSDETKSVWLECLLLSGEEYTKEEMNFQCSCSSLLDQVYEPANTSVRKHLQTFLEVLLIENNRSLYQGVFEFKKIMKISESAQNQDPLGEYHMRSVCRFINLGHGVNSSTTNEPKKCLPSLLQLFNLLEPKDLAKSEENQSEPSCEEDTFEHYNQLRGALQNIMNVSCGVTRAEQNTRVLLFAKQELTLRYLHLSPYYNISPFPTIQGNDVQPNETVPKEVQKQSEALQNELQEKGYGLFSSANNINRYNVLIMLDNNYDYFLKLKELDILQFMQKIEPVYLYFPCELPRVEALMLVRKILMFRCKLISWLERDFNNNAMATLVQQRHWAKILSADKVGDHSENDFIASMQNLLTLERTDSTELETVICTIDENGEASTEYETDISGIQNRAYATWTHIDRTKEWFLLCSYVNSRIARLYRTLVRTEGLGERIDINAHYAREHQSIWIRPLNSLRDALEVPLRLGNGRKNYILQMMEVVSFQVQVGERRCTDYEKGIAIAERFKTFCETLSSYKCIKMKKDGKNFSYLSEYIVAILLDCCLSALKASEIWSRNMETSSAVFQEFSQLPPDQKCQICLSKEPGTSDNFDYLIIQNEVYPNNGKRGNRFGMSQAAMRWYVENLWSFVEEGNNHPKVEISNSDNIYTIKLPILRPNESGENQ